MIEKCEEIDRLLGGIMNKAGLFGGDEYKVSRESVAEYFVQTER